MSSSVHSVIKTIDNLTAQSAAEASGTTRPCAVQVANREWFITGVLKHCTAPERPPEENFTCVR
ncbi:hypothetical protein I79_012317 [Cricetulus griseus]|uniref:Uncharacterized protein n=1 Tax=Cricetulus griseus TaxID=10029 RepID=G3HNH9_CRIGR|nr:hypothetical protein I79_012317 [Cricetulus griseus]